MNGGTSTKQLPLLCLKRLSTKGKINEKSLLNENIEKEKGEALLDSTGRKTQTAKQIKNISKLRSPTYGWDSQLTYAEMKHLDSTSTQLS